MRGPSLLHQNRKIKPRRPPTNDVDLHIKPQKGTKDTKQKEREVKACNLNLCLLCILWLTLLQQLAGNDELLDFGGALVDAQRAHVAIEAFDDCSTHQAGAAVNLNCAVDDSASSFGGKQLGFARFASKSAAPGISRVGGTIDKESSSVELGDHVSQFGLDQLMFRQQTSELFSIG